jgi:hypothetical protein
MGLNDLKKEKEKKTKPQNTTEIFKVVNYNKRTMKL